MSTNEGSPDQGGDLNAHLSAATAWKVLWRRHLGRLFPAACAVMLVAAGFGLAYRTTYRRSYAAGYAAGCEAHLSRERAAKYDDWRYNGTAQAYQRLGWMLFKGTLDGLWKGWCLLKLGEKPSDPLGSPVQDFTVLHPGKRYALNIDGTVWFRE